MLSNEIVNLFFPGSRRMRYMYAVYVGDCFSLKKTWLVIMTSNIQNGRCDAILAQK